MKMVCIGDSFTVGPGVTQENHWLYILGKRFTNYEFVNRGINGDTTSGMLARLKRDVIDEKPNYALIIGGTNDIICQGGPHQGEGIAPTIKSNYMAMVHQLFNANIKPIIAMPLPCINSMIPSNWAAFYDFAELNDELYDLNMWQRSFARSFLCPIIDIFNPFVEAILNDTEAAPDLYLDGLHLSAEGHKLVADIMIGQLEQILHKADG